MCPQITEEDTKSFLTTILIVMGLFLAVFNNPVNEASHTVFSYSFAFFVISALLLYSQKTPFLISFLLGGTFSVIFLIFIVPNGLYVFDDPAKNLLIFTLLYFLVAFCLIYYFTHYYEYMGDKLLLLIMTVSLSFIISLLFYINAGELEVVQMLATLILTFILVTLFYGVIGEKIELSFLYYLMQMIVGSIILFIFYILGVIVVPINNSNGPELIESSIIVLKNCTIISENCSYDFTELAKEFFPLITFTPLTKIRLWK